MTTLREPKLRAEPLTVNGLLVYVPLLNSTSLVIADVGKMVGE